MLCKELIFPSSFKEQIEVFPCGGKIGLREHMQTNLKLQGIIISYNSRGNFHWLIFHSR